MSNSVLLNLSVISFRSSSTPLSESLRQPQHVTLKFMAIKTGNMILFVNEGRRTLSSRSFSYRGHLKILIRDITDLNDQII